MGVLGLIAEMAIGDFRAAGLIDVTFLNPEIGVVLAAGTFEDGGGDSNICIALSWAGGGALNASGSSVVRGRGEGSVSHDVEGIIRPTYGFKNSSNVTLSSLVVTETSAPSG